MVEEPDWMARIVGEWNTSEVVYAFVTTAKAIHVTQDRDIVIMCA